MEKYAFCMLIEQRKKRAFFTKQHVKFYQTLEFIWFKGS